MNYRIFIEKKPEYQTEKFALINDLNDNLHLNISDIRLLNIYDIFNVTLKELEIIKTDVLQDPVTDNTFNEISLSTPYLALENVPGQYDIREDQASQCIHLLVDNNDILIKTGTLIIFKDEVDIEKVKKYLINPIEKREKDLLSPLNIDDNIAVKPLEKDDNFINYSENELINFLRIKGYTMSLNDLLFIQNYYRENEKRNPTEVELAVLDTYWSDHCRHTTFNTFIDNVLFPSSEIGNVMKKVYKRYCEIKKEIGDFSPLTLMNLATVYGKYLSKCGKLNDLVDSVEKNACSILVDVKVDQKNEKYILLFKNETHNHPTEIEPFGGAATCIGGAIRDPLSARGFVYQAMRISGAGNILEPIEKTIKGKLPQKIISQKSALGYSSYGNQIGLPTTFVKEIYHEGYKAKHLELGAVVGCVKESDFYYGEPIAGDCIILIGGKTGRDGIGGATGSSTKHNSSSLESSSQEVQKGNPIIERKLQRLIRKNKVTRLIKSCNDFGAGGVAVAIGELAPSLEIHLDNIPVKYLGLNPLELALSESQERLAVIVSKENVKAFIDYALEENLLAVVVAYVTDNNRLVMKYHDEVVVDISRTFLDTFGCRNQVNIQIPELKSSCPFENINTNYLANLKKMNVSCQKGLSEMFDSTVLATTVLLPYGGKYQMTEADASVQKLPINKAETCSILSYGFNPEISSWSPFHGAVYAIIESIARVVASGGNYQKIRFSFQEYFKKLGDNPLNWGEVFAALLGALYTQDAFLLPSIGGKDSMSGSFNDLHVPPTLVSFAVMTENIENIISQEFKAANNYLYLFDYDTDSCFLPNINTLKSNYDYIYRGVRSKTIISAMAVKNGGVAEVLAKMAFGNKIGFKVKADLDLYSPKYGAILVESVTEIKAKNADFIGMTTTDELIIGESHFTIAEALNSYQETFKSIYPLTKVNEGKIVDNYPLPTPIIKTKGMMIEPEVLIPIFPGTNCEYETEKAFIDAGAKTKTLVFQNLNKTMIKESLKRFELAINKSQILVFSGGFSAGDEPDGSGKFIKAVLMNESIRAAIEKFLDHDGLILGICNGFQALIKSGLLPYGKIGLVKDNSPTLVRNNISRHVAKMVRTKITSKISPWFMDMELNDVYHVAVSHGEGKFVGSTDVIKKLFLSGQVATQYVDFDNNPTMDGEFNPNGSYSAIEGITSPCGKILGKMGHSERMVEGLYKNFPVGKSQNIFKNGVNYFK